MHHAEFVEQATAIAAQIPELAAADRIPAACRGSGNPAMLSWLAEGLLLDAHSTVVDIGAGIGGPAAWLNVRYRTTVIAVEPSEVACSAARRLFGLPAVCASAEVLPFADAQFHSALLLGVCSVVANNDAVLREARRVANKLAVLDYAAAGSEPVSVGGSTFLPSQVFTRSIHRAGWTVAQVSDVVPPTPASWTSAGDSIDVETDPGEAEVASAIAEGKIIPFMMIAVPS